MEQDSNNDFQKVQVIENRVQLECLIVSTISAEPDVLHYNYKIKITSIRQVAGYPDLVSNQDHEKLQLRIRREELSEQEDIIGKKISCQVAWAPNNKLYGIKNTMKIIS
jgi:hypothetical protein